MIDQMTRSKIHHMNEGATLQAVIAEKCAVGLRSVQRVLREPAPTLEELAIGRRGGAPRRGRSRDGEQAQARATGVMEKTAGDRLSPHALAKRKPPTWPMSVTQDVAPTPRLQPGGPAAPECSDT